MINIISRFKNRGYLLRNLIVRDLKSKYAGSFMGLFWVFINPILMLLVYTYIFSVILNIKWQNHEYKGSFALNLLCGLLPWIAFQDAVSRSTTSIVENGELLKNHPFPAKIFAVCLVISSIINEVIALVLIMAAVFILKGSLSILILLLPLVILIQACFTLGIAWAVSAVNVFFRDIASLMGVVLMIWMFVTPIFYPPEMVPAGFRMFLKINPMYYLVQIYRDIILEGRLPDPLYIIVFLIFSAISFFAGYALFNRLQTRFVDYL